MLFVFGVGINKFFFFGYVDFVGNDVVVVFLIVFVVEGFVFFGVVFGCGFDVGVVVVVVMESIEFFMGYVVGVEVVDIISGIFRLGWRFRVVEE